MHKINPTLQLRLWLETPMGTLMGLGRAELLSGIHDSGSLNKAAKAMGMSYRWAWGRLKECEATVGEPLVTKVSGLKGFVLTPLGEELVKAFKLWNADVEAYALQRARELFPWPVKPIEELPRKQAAS